jgi:hypothetical protein
MLDKSHRSGESHTTLSQADLDIFLPLRNTSSTIREHERDVLLQPPPTTRQKCLRSAKGNSYDLESYIRENFSSKPLSQNEYSSGYSEQADSGSHCSDKFSSNVSLESYNDDKAREQSSGFRVIGFRFGENRVANRMESEECFPPDSLGALTQRSTVPIALYVSFRLCSSLSQLGGLSNILTHFR